MKRTRLKRGAAASLSCKSFRQYESMCWKSDGKQQESSQQLRCTTWTRGVFLQHVLLKPRESIGQHLMGQILKN